MRYYFLLVNTPKVLGLIASAMLLTPEQTSEISYKTEQESVSVHETINQSEN